MAGVGIGLSMSQGGSTGGTDIIALIWCKFKPSSPGRVILIIDIMIILSSLLLPSYNAAGELLPYPEKIAIVVYGLMQVTVCGYAIDLYISGSKQSVQVFIFTKKVQQMADAYNIGRANAKIAEKKAQSTIADSSSEETTPMVENVEPSIMAWSWRKDYCFLM